MSDFGLEFVDAPPAPEHFNVLLYGPPKSGKSTAAASAPGPLLWLNLEGPGALLFARKTAMERGAEILEVRPDRNDQLRTVMHGIVAHVDQHPGEVGTVVVDTIGKVRDHLARNIVQQGSRNSMNQWREVAGLIESWVQALRDRPVNVVLIAHEAVSDSDDGERIVEPLIGGASTAKVEGEVDVIAYCGRIEGEDGARYMGQLVSAKGRRAGERSNGLGSSRELDLTEWLHTFREALRPDLDEDEQMLFGGDES